jgi:hypothetical protein
VQLHRFPPRQASSEPSSTSEPGDRCANLFFRRKASFVGFAETFLEMLRLPLIVFQICTQRFTDNLSPVAILRSRIASSDSRILGIDAHGQRFGGDVLQRNTLEYGNKSRAHRV